MEVKVPIFHTVSKLLFVIIVLQQWSFDPKVEHKFVMATWNRNSTFYSMILGNDPHNLATWAPKNTLDYWLLKRQTSYDLRANCEKPCRRFYVAVESRGSFLWSHGYLIISQEAHSTWALFHTLIGYHCFWVFGKLFFHELATPNIIAHYSAFGQHQSAGCILSN